MVVEQKVTSMTTLKIKSYLLGPILNNFQRGLGKKILPFHFLNLHHEFGNSFFSKFWHINQKKFMKQKRQQIDHRVAWRRPFLRFQLHFWDIVAGATHRRGRSNPPKVCLPPLCKQNEFKIQQRSSFFKKRKKRKGWRNEMIIYKLKLETYFIARVLDLLWSFLI